MARKKSKSEWKDNRSSKRSNPFEPKQIKNIPPRKHWSFRFPQFKEEDPFCSPFDGIESEIEGVGRRSGTLVSYSPVQTERYQSQYMRYIRAQSIFPDKIEESDGRIYYYYQSCDSPTGFWIVTLSPGTITIDAGDDVIDICSDPFFLFGSVLPEDTPVVWTQISGETVTINEPNSPITSVNRNGTIGPYEFRLSAVDDPDIFDDVLVWTTPISIYPGPPSLQNGHYYPYPDCAIPPCTIYLAPYLPPAEQAIQVQPNTLIPIRWPDPTCYAGYLYEIQIQTNTGSGWTVHTSIDVLEGEDRYAVLAQGTSDGAEQRWYRIVYRYRVNDDPRGFSTGEGSLVDVPGCSFWIEFDNITLLVDELWTGLSVGGGDSSVVDYGIITLFGIDQYTISLMGSDSSVVNYGSVICSETDSYTGVSTGGRSSSITDYALGGIIIG